MTRSATDVCGVGSPAILFLEQFGSIVWDAFGSPPYLVGSSLKGKTWRDVDVRLMLPDAEFFAMFGQPAPLHSWTSGKWAAMCMAFSVLGKQMTGLPIDFQIQGTTHANKAYPDGPRQAIGLIEARRGESTQKEPSMTTIDPLCDRCGGSRDAPNRLEWPDGDEGNREGLKCDSEFHDAPSQPYYTERVNGALEKVAKAAGYDRAWIAPSGEPNVILERKHPTDDTKIQITRLDLIVGPTPHTLGFSDGEPIDLRTLQRMNLARVSAYGMEIDDWSPMAWGSELAEEVGEFQREVLVLGSVLGRLLGAVKKRSRTPHPTEPGKDISGKDVPSLEAVSDELADVVIVTNLLASRLGIDLNNAVRSKWNKTSAKVGWSARL